MAGGTAKRGPSRRAFSLVEVVIAIGIASFVVVGIMGLWAVGLRTESQSSETVTAANLAALIINQRRLFPTNTSPANMALPSLATSQTNYSSPEYVGLDGCTTNRSDSSYALIYSVTQKPRSSNVHLI